PEGFAAQAATPPDRASFPTGTFFAIFAVIWLLMIAVYITFAVAWHRRYLLGPDRTSPRELLTWKGRHWRFIWKGILIALLALLLMFVLNLLISFPVGLMSGMADPGRMDEANLASSVGIFFAGYFITLLFVMALLAGPLLAFPAAAVEDREFGIRAGWRAANGNRWRMVGAYMFGAVIPVMIIQVILLVLLTGGLAMLGITFFPALGGSISFGIVLNLIINVVYFFGIAIGVSMLSIMYERLRKNVPPEAEAPSP
ncbi:MAG: hypothetical protein JJ899_16715, partial [Alphaproteobacteria bacterium]|nr:hypothetical protein [Alphaproteobacteria bacterium]